VLTSSSMRRAAAIALAALLPATAAVAEPLDIDIGLLGAPSANVWAYVGGGTWGSPGANDVQLANDAKARFGMLSSELALAMTSSLLTPGSTTGHSGFDMAMEGAYAATHTQDVGSASGTVAGAAFGPRDYWPVRGAKPTEVFVPAVRIRKSLPFSVELGARFKYLSQSSLFAGQFETKWAFFEGDRILPDFALRIALTRLGGVRALNVGTSDFDFIVSKRFGVLGVVSLTPYGALRYTFMRASSDTMVFFPAAAAATPSIADTEARTSAFPNLAATFFRMTAGVRMTTYALSLAAELTQYGGGAFQPEGYPKFSVKPSIAGSFRLGFEY
jgi:hypothetical protein